jgi:hypothetical protein
MKHNPNEDLWLCKAQYNDDGNGTLSFNFIPKGKPIRKWKKSVKLILWNHLNKKREFSLSSFFKIYGIPDNKLLQEIYESYLERKGRKK